MNIKNFWISVLILVAAIICLCINGCKRCNLNIEDYEYESAAYVLDDWIKNPMLPSEMRERAILANQLLHNKTLDVEPLLVGALLVKAEGYSRLDLALLIYDEDCDVTHFVIIEESYDPNGESPVMVAESEYPLYLHQLPLSICDIYFVPNDIIIKNQKDEETYIHDLSNDTGSEDKSPPLYISSLDQNKVYIYVYDKQGNKSNVVRLEVGKGVFTE